MSDETNNVPVEGDITAEELAVQTGALSTEDVTGADDDLPDAGDSPQTEDGVAL